MIYIIPALLVGILILGYFTKFFVRILPNPGIIFGIPGQSKLVILIFPGSHCVFDDENDEN